VVVNDDFERALSELGDIVAGRGEALRADRVQLAGLLDELLAGP
jgi:hypothetical protein